MGGTLKIRESLILFRQQVHSVMKINLQIVYLGEELIL